jgi:hypothetical protein
VPLTLLALSALLAGCKGAPRDALTWEERWEVLVLTEHGNILDTRMIVSNRELLRGQSRVHMDYWSPSSLAILHTRELRPANVQIDPDGGGVRLGMDGLYQDDGWTLQIGSTDANLMLHIQPEIEAPTPVSWQPGGGQWSMEALVAGGSALGWLEAGGRGGRFSGRAVVLHRGGDGSPSLPRQAVFVTAKDTWVGIDQQDGATLAWAWLDGQRIAVSDLVLKRTPQGASLDFRPAADLVIDIQAHDPVGSSDPLGHFTWLERTAAEVLSDVAWRRVEAGGATVIFGGESRSAQAILLSEGPDFEPIGSGESNP